MSEERTFNYSAHRDDGAADFEILINHNLTYFPHICYHHSTSLLLFRNMNSEIRTKVMIIQEIIFVWNYKNVSNRPYFIQVF